MSRFVQEKVSGHIPMCQLECGRMVSIVALMLLVLLITACGPAATNLQPVAAEPPSEALLQKPALAAPSAPVEQAVAALPAAPSSVALAALADTVVDENEGLAIFVVRLTTAHSTDVRVRYSTGSGTAVAGQDFHATTGELSIPAGTVMATFGIPIIDDHLPEPTEVFYVDLYAASDVRLADNRGTATIRDDDAPDLPDNPVATDCRDAAPTPAVLWPANHQWVKVEIRLPEVDDNTLRVVVERIYQDEPLDARGDGNFEPDAQGIGTATAHLRAEREGKGNGRVYTIDFSAYRGNDRICQGTVQVTVPHDRGRQKSAIDDGAKFDSTGASFYVADEWGDDRQVEYDNRRDDNDDNDRRGPKKDGKRDKEKPDQKGKKDKEPKGHRGGKENDD